MKVYIGRYPSLKRMNEGKERTVRIRIDKHDTYNMDHTLALIIYPMLLQLKATKHGSPHVDVEDVPDHLKNVQEANRDLVHERWDWVLDEIIWTFEKKVKNDDMLYDSQEDSKRMMNGFRLFGKYYEALWD